MHETFDVEVSIGLDESESESSLRAKVAGCLGREIQAGQPLTVVRRSLDARHGHVRYRLMVRVGGDSSVARQEERPPREVRLPARVLIVGDGPAGLFCAYELARRGIASIVLDRGKPVQPRRHDLKAIHRDGHVDPNSNYCFGEGGAGTYSDGKLYTRAHKRGSIRDVLEILVAHGAPPEVLVDARPHIGSNRLPRVVTALREHLESVGVEFRFGAPVVDLVRGGRGIEGVRIADGREVFGDIVVLATGHSARDVFGLLERHGARLQAKAFAVGVRIEHPQELIDRIQYGSAAGHPRLPPASYRLSREIEGRGVFSFCMCPGGFVVPAATEADGVVVNGMSLSRRGFAFANSGLVVGVEVEDLTAAGLQGPCAGIELQRRLEQAAFRAGGGALRAPAVRVADFLAGRASSTIGDTSYIPGLAATRLDEVLDAGGVAVAWRLRSALQAFGRSLRGYTTGDAVLIGVETRTSSPVRVLRHADSLEAQGLPRVYPCGEGAGYAGGIVSAALDGMRVASRVAAALGD